MRKTIAALFFLASTAAFAQNDAVTDAFLSNKDGELDKAKEAIDRAVLHEKTKDKPKTWYFRGMIYKNLLLSKDPRFATISQNAAQTAYDSYKKSIELSPKKDDEYARSSADDIKAMSGLVFNSAVAYFTGADTIRSEKNAALRKDLFTKSLQHFELAAQMLNQDTLAYLNANMAAVRLGDYEKSRELTFKLFSLGKQNPMMYVYLSRLASSANKQDSALAHLVQARKVYPTNKDLALEELQWYFSAGKSKEVRSKLEESIKLDSTNALLYSNLGNLYDQEAADPKTPAKDREVLKQKALAAYRKTLKFDPNNMESNFNLGVFFFNKGAEILKKVNDLDINTYQKKGKTMEAEAQAEFKNSVPYFEACYKINPKDESVIRSLRNAYERVGRSADAEKLGK
jgi:tetratricopeptide (TPR) repeat protein